MRLYLTLLSLILLSACSLQKSSIAATGVNAKIVATEGHLFADTLKQHLNPNLPQTLKIELSEEKTKRITNSYRGGSASSYRLLLAVEVRVYHGPKLLLDTKLSQSSFSLDNKTYLANQLQQQAEYQDLRKILARRLVKQLAILQL